MLIFNRYDVMKRYTCFILDNYVPYDTFENVYFDPTGVYETIDAQRSRIENSVLKRQRFQRAPQYSTCREVDKNTIVEVVDEVFLLNHYNSAHYGHFLTETLARFYSILVDKHLPCNNVSVSIPTHEKTDPSVYNTDHLKSLIPDAKITVNLDKRYFAKKLILPRPTLHLMSGIYKEHLDTLRAYGNMYKRTGASRKGKRVYFSKTKWRPDEWVYRRFEGEHIIENELRDMGWEIVYPELLPLGEQIRILETADVVAGCLGSNLHTLMMCEKYPRAVVYLTGSVFSTERTHALQDTVINEYDDYYFNCFSDMTTPRQRSRGSIAVKLKFQKSKIDKLKKFLKEL